MGKFVRTYESPIPLEYEGRDAVARFCASVIRPGQIQDLVPTQANGQPAILSDSPA